VAASIKPATGWLAAQKLPTGVVAFVAGQLATENGQAFMAICMGNVMGVLPMCVNDKHLNRLGREIRTLGYTRFANVFAEAVVGPMRDGLLDIVKNLIP